MADDPAAARTVVIMGGRGDLAESVRRGCVAQGWTIVPVRRGDDPGAALRRALAVVVLEGATGDAAAYTTALGALAASILTAPAISHVVAVMRWPPEAKRRSTVIGRCKAAEDNARTSGVPLVVVRHGLVVGSVDLRAPADRWLFAGRLNAVTVPTSKEQAHRPLRLDDLGALVAVALTADVRPEARTDFDVEGPETMPLAELVRSLNDRETRIISISKVVPTVLILAALVALSGGFLLAPSSVLGLVAAFYVLLLVYVMLESGRRHVPDGELLLRASGQAAPLAGVELRDAKAVWNYDGRRARAARRREKRALWSFRGESSAPVVALYLVVSGALAVVAGVHDVLHASSLGPRMEAGLLVLVGCGAVVGGSVLAFIRWARRYLVAFVACVSMTLTLGVLLLAGLVNGDAPPVWALVFVDGLVPGVMASVVLAGRSALEATRFFASKGPKAIASFAALGIFAAIAQFYFGTVYLSATATPTVSVKADLRPSAPIGDRVPLTAIVQLKNNAKAAVNVVGSLYTVETERVRAIVPESATSSLSIADAVTWEHALESPGRVSSYVREVDQVVAERGTLVDPSTYLEPGEEIDRRFVAFVPRGTRLATLRVDLVLTRRRFSVAVENPLVVEHVSIPGSPATNVATTSAKIQDDIWTHRLTRSARYIHTLTALEADSLPRCNPGVSLDAYIDGSAATAPYCSSGNERLAGYYALTSTEASIEIVITG